MSKTRLGWYSNSEKTEAKKRQFFFNFGFLTPAFK